MLYRLWLMLAALDAGRVGYIRKHEAIANHAARWSMLSMLIVLLYPLVAWPLEVFLFVIKHGQALPAAADTFYLSGNLRVLIVSTIVMMIAAGIVLSGVARTVMNEFSEQRFAALTIGTAAVGLIIYVGYVSSVVTGLLGLTRGDNALLAVLLITWAGAVGRVCAVAADRARDNWDVGAKSFLRF